MHLNQCSNLFSVTICAVATTSMQALVLKKKTSAWKSVLHHKKKKEEKPTTLQLGKLLTNDGCLWYQSLYKASVCWHELDPSRPGSCKLPNEL